ncbi:MAG: type VI secretion system tip protein VgrG [Deltaproteobacteria bacterium]|nr:type VI secretion system tip protein VgrG [Deltaproteobacteria bacterium]
MTMDGELTLTLETPEPVTVVAAHVAERLSTPTVARVEVASTIPLVLDDVLEKDATLAVAPPGGPPRRFTLRVGHVDFLRIVDGSLRYAVQLFPAFWLLRFTKNQRKFRNQSAEQIVSTILGEHQVAHRFELARPTEQRKYCVQYRETNLDFVHRLLEFEGIHYAFEDDGTMVLADRSSDAAAVPGQSVFDLVEVQGAMQWTSIGIREVKKGRKVTSGTATVSDFNWKKPRVKLLASASAKEDGELEVYDYPVGFRREDQGSLLARRRLEAYRVEASHLKGVGNAHTFAPGRSFTFGPLASLRFAGEYLLVGVDHHYRSSKFEHTAEGGSSDGITYENRFHAIPKDVPFRPPLVTPEPHIAGTHTAMVRGPAGEEIHTDTHGRFRAQFHWDREANGSDEDSRWLRNLQETASGMGLARIGWEQSVAYLNGDPDRPVGIARNINGHMTPEYAQPAGKTRHAMKSPSYPSASGGFNELRMDDLAGLMKMEWHAEKDHIVGVDHDRTETIAGNETRSVGATFAATVGNDQSVTIGGNLKVNVGNDHGLAVETDRTKTVGGEESVKVTKVYSVTVGGDELEKVGGTRSVEAAEQGGSVTRQIQQGLEREAAAWTVKGPGNVELTVQDTLKESVGAAKNVEVAEGGISLRVGGKWDVTVTANVKREVGKRMGYSAKETTVAVQGSATLEAGEKITLNGDAIILEATSALELKSGQVGLKLEPGKTTIAGKMLVDAPSGKMRVSGNKNLLTR